MALSKPEDGQRLRAKIIDLEKHAERALSEVLRLMIRNLNYDGDDLKRRKTSKHADTAITEYFEHKTSVLIGLCKHMTNEQKKLFYENGTLRQIIKISTLDISAVALLLLNIPDLQTCFSINSNSRPGNCSNGNHATDAKCCAVCDHRENYCKSCNVSKFLCKDNKYLCCSNCNLCVHCSQQTAQPPCQTYKLRFAIFVIRLLRNLKSHTTSENWMNISTNTWMPDDFKFSGITCDALWNTCKENVKHVYDFLNTNKHMNKDEYDKIIHELGQLDHMTDNEQMMTIAKEIITKEPIIYPTPSQKQFEIEVALSQKSKGLSKKVWNWLRQTKQLSDYFSDKLDSDFVCKIEEILKETINEEVGKNNGMPDVGTACSCKVNCEKIDPKYPIKEFILTIRIEHQKSEKFNSLYSDRNSDNSKELWENFKKTVVDFAKKELNLSIKLDRQSWRPGSILITLCITKIPFGNLKAFEKEYIIRLIEQLPSKDEFFTSYTITTVPLKDVFNGEEEFVLSFSGEFHGNVTHEDPMDIYPVFEKRLQERFEAMTSSPHRNLPYSSDIHMKLKQFALVDSFEGIPFDEQSLTLNIDSVNVQEDPIYVEEDPVNVKEDPVNIEEDPFNVKKDPVDVKEDPAYLKDDPVNVKEVPIRASSTKPPLPISFQPTILHETEKSLDEIRCPCCLKSVLEYISHELKEEEAKELLEQLNVKTDGDLVNELTYVPWKNIKTELEVLERIDIITYIKENTLITQGLQNASHNLHKLYVDEMIDCLVEKPLSSVKMDPHNAKLKEIFTDLVVIPSSTVDLEWNNSDRESLMKQTLLQRSSQVITVDELIEAQDEIVFIRGVAGVGKSTVIDKFTLKWAKNELSIPFTSEFVFKFTCRELNNLSNEVKTFEQLMMLCFPKIFHHITLEDLVEVSSHVVIVVDGLDELEDLYYMDSMNLPSIPQGQFLQLICDLINPTSMQPLKKHKTIVCGRQVACEFVKKQLVAFVRTKTIEVCGFNQENSQKYIHNFFNKDRVKAQKVQDIIASSDNLKTMSAVPVFIWVICFVYDADRFNTSINTTTELYFYTCILFLGKHHHEYSYERLPNIVNDKSMMKVVFSLMVLSKNTYLQNQVVFTDKDIKKLKCPFPLEKTGFIVKYSGSSSSIANYQFRHFILQEFLCAMYLYVKKGISASNRQLPTLWPMVLEIHQVVKTKENKHFVQFYKGLRKASKTF